MSVQSICSLLLAAALVASTSINARAEAPDPIKIAVFDIEIDDFRDKASSPEQPGDAYNLLLATEALKRTLATDTRFAVVNPQPTNWATSQFKELRYCNGCESEIALRLGADRSLLVVVTRVSMTDYLMSYQVRDAHAGTSLASENSDLRMGANYSWPRGANWLVRNKIASAP